MKVCKRCKKPKDKSKFRERKQRNGSFYFVGICKKCELDKSVEYSRTKRGLIRSIYSHQKSHSKTRKMNQPTYSKEWLSEWLISSVEFHRLYDMWVISGYDIDLVPSVDRIDDYISYTEYNIQLMTFKDNVIKRCLDMKSGKNNKKSKAVIRLTKDLIKVDEFYSAMEASRATSINNSKISAVCRGDRKTAGGFVWKYKNE